MKYAKDRKLTSSHTAEVLIEAFPWIKNATGKTILIKYGGAAMVDEKLRDAVMSDIVMLKIMGVNPVIVHGGGAAITENMERYGLDVEFKNGQRVTTDEAMDVVKMTLIGKVKNNPAIRIPIIGNGDIDSGPKAREMFDRYGVDGVMIGRATYGRPWIFREVKHFLETGEVMPQPSVAERVEIAKEHLAKSLEIKGGRVGILEMRRHLSNYFKGLPNFKETRLKLVTLFDPNELYATLDSIADRWGDFDVSGVIPAPLSHDV